MQGKVQGPIEDVDFEKAMEIAGYGKFSAFVILVSGLSLCVPMLGAMDVSYLLPTAQCDLDLSSERKGLLGSAYFIGIIAASHLSGFLADTRGRRYILVRGTSLNVIVYIFGSMAPNVWLFVLLKILSGALCASVLTAMLPLLGELVPRRRSSQAVLVAMSFSSLYLLYSSLIGWLILGDEWTINLYLLNFTPWRLFYLLCCFPSLLSATLLLLIPESPRFLLASNNEDALKVLRKIYSYNTGNIAESYPVQSVTKNADEASSPEGAAGLLRHILDQTLPLFKSPHLRNTILCNMLSFIFFLCHDTMLLWLPEITNRMAYYDDSSQQPACFCEMVESEVDYKPNTSINVSCQDDVQDDVFIPNIILGVAHPTALLAGSFLVRLVDRRLSMAIFMTLCSLMILLVTLMPTSLPITLLLTGFPILMSVCNSMTSSITIEIFPACIRAMAVALMTISGRLGSVAGAHLFSQLIDSHCLLLFHLLSLALIFLAALPFRFHLKN
ncbi:synaptic vesicle glycoprotein 2B-like [Homalodisca vitripennis]|uniref:synaptic vesicle glycoprotein 2B-like n=1 Tax=Homalodisca vitripennis TaxID=197043 RepID=UPI001EEC90CB|nr:synaptic vesicle glycoprotein 2B-like [Homalodisca vitripennis]